MYAVKGTYDGSAFHVKDRIPVKGEYEVIITFVRPAPGNSQREILKYAGIFDQEDVRIMERIMAERGEGETAGAEP
ncbi:MAG: hypothetical protein LBR38_04195 [Synergistaceae bacterium]|nr:hypothetical protein [Synergistaceae bacterium]